MVFPKMMESELTIILSLTERIFIDGVTYVFLLLCSPPRLLQLFPQLLFDFRFSVFQFVFTFLGFRFPPDLETEPAIFGILSRFLKIASDVSGFSLRCITNLII